MIYFAIAWALLFILVIFEVIKKRQKSEARREKFL